MFITLVALAGSLAACADEAPPGSGSPPDSVQVSSEAEWTELPPGPLSARYSSVAEWTGSSFFVIGGYEGQACPPNADCALPPHPPLSDGAAFDVTSMKWRAIAPAPEPVTGRSVVVGTTLYVLTFGYGGNGDDAAFLAYDIDSDQWSELTSPKNPNAWLAATSDQVVAFDEDHGRNTVYDATADRWRPLPSIPFWDSSGGYPVWTGSELLVARHAEVPNDEAPVVQLASLDQSLTQWTDLGDTDIVGWGPVRVGSTIVWPSLWSLDGGETDNWGRAYPEGAIFQPTTGEWSDMPAEPSKHGGLSRLVVTDGLVSLDGNLLDPVTRLWTGVPEPPGGARYDEVLVGGADSVMLWGGALTDGDGSSLDTGYLLELGR